MKEAIDLIVERLRRETRAQGKTDVQLAEESGVSRQTLGRMWGMESIPRLETLDAVARALHVSIQIRVRPESEVSV